MELDEEKIWKDINESAMAAEVMFGRIPLQPPPSLISQNAAVRPIYKDDKIWGFDLTVTAVFNGMYQLKDKQDAS